MDARALVLRFNRAINSRDLGELAALMADDHRLVTGSEAPVIGKAACLHAWARFFELVPDYRNVFEVVEAEGGTVRVAGHSASRDERLNGPALWVAQVAPSGVREWRVCSDTPEHRKDLGFSTC
ncbi:MAG: nuclear transport factor 2 family protein [Gemmatimonadetes bacterium]|nr:nuclear transport factor 2 family protein [Gemmatimonadota bacterium]